MSEEVPATQKPARKGRRIEVVFARSPKTNKAMRRAARAAGALFKKPVEGSRPEGKRS